MASLEQLAAVDVRRVVVRYRDALRAHQEELNRLNVYPVPDGDTGTNMALTLESVCEELATCADDVDGAPEMQDVCRAVSHGSLMGARGNSGVILSQVLRGLAETFAPTEAAGGLELVIGLRRAADAAYQAVLRPVEGTILTVVREAAEAAEAAGAARDTGRATLTEILDIATSAARDAVARTPQLLPVLKEAGVVDAGGRGFALLLDALLEVVDGRPIPEPEIVATPPSVEAHLRGDDLASLRYEVMYLLDADDETLPGFKDAWGAIGDSIVVVGGEGTWNCHVHTDDIGAAVEAGIDAGRPYRIRVTDLLEQVSERQEEEWVRTHQAPGSLDETAVHVASTEPVATAIVAVAVGEGVRRLFTSLGVQAIVAGGQSMNPSTAQILEAVDATNAEAVLVLPNNKNIVPVARQVSELTERKVDVLPTTAVVQGLAALVAYDPAAPLEGNLEAMGAAVEHLRSGEVTQAVRDSVAECGRITAGDWIAIVDRAGIQAAVKSPADAAIALIDELIDDESELVTVLLGADAPPAETARLTEHLALVHPDVEIEVHHGDQALYPYLIGVE